MLFVIESHIQVQIETQNHHFFLFAQGCEQGQQLTWLILLSK